jgi:endonuclease III-like uncharacterized protein
MDKDLESLLFYLTTCVDFKVNDYCKSSLKTLLYSYDTETIKESIHYVFEDGRCETYNHFFAYVSCVCKQKYDEPIKLNRGCK